MITKAPQKERGLILSRLLGALLAVLIIGSLLIGTQACSSSKAKKTQSADSSKTEQILYDVNLATLAVNRDFPRFLTAAWSRKADYGFKADDEQKDASLAKPILVYGIDEEIVGKMPGEEGLTAAVEPVGEWIYPVQVKQEYRTLFGVRLRSNNEWRGTYLGTSRKLIFCHEYFPPE